MSPISSSLWFDAGSVSAAPELIYHGNCEWRTGTAAVQRRAALNPPSSHFIAAHLCQGCSLSGERRPCALELQMGKNNRAHIIITLLQQIQKKAKLAGRLPQRRGGLRKTPGAFIRKASAALIQCGSGMEARVPSSCPFVEGGVDSGEGMVLAVVGGWGR